MSDRHRGGRLLPLTYVFGSFFGAAMIAAAFAYNHYRFSQFKFIDFNELVLFKKADIFAPTQDRYTLLFFSSNQEKIDQILPEIKSDFPILAIDLSQKRQVSQSGVDILSSDINTILKMLFMLNISELPSSVDILRYEKNIFKQDSKINKIRR